MLRLKTIRGFVSFERNLLILGSTNAAMSVFWNSWYPFVPLYLSYMGASPTIVGLIFSIIALASSFAYYVGGYMADRFGRKVPIVVGGGTGCICLLAAMLTSDWAAVGLLLVLATSLFSLQTTTPSLMIVESVDEKERGKALGNWEFYNKLGPVIGPMLASAVSPVHQLKSLLFLSLVAIAAGTAIRAVGLVETFGRGPFETEGEQASIRDRLRGSLLIFLASCIIFSLSGGLVWPFVSIFASEFLRMSTAELGMMFSLNNFAILASGMPAGKAVDKFGPKKVLILGYFLACATNIPWIYSPSPSFAILFSTVSNVFLEFGGVAYQMTIVKMTRQETRGRIMGGFDAMYVMTYSAGSAIGGLIWERASPRFLFWVSALLAIPMGLMMAFMHVDS
ncbi:MAG: MFS transporter [Candidatus Brockarchaeota archaeon]|nr:MFS transporter [Candidatus Brockarchaeota archaeon]